MAHALRWPPPLASRLELAFDATLLVQSSPFLQSRDGARTPLKGGCNTFAFCKVLLSTIYQAVLALIYFQLAPAVCDIVDSSLVPGPPPGVQARCVEAGYQYTKEKIDARPIGGSLYSLRLPTSGLGPGPAHNFSFEVLGAHT